VSAARFPGLGDARVLPPALRGPFDSTSQAWLEELAVAPYDAISELQPSRVMPVMAGRLAVVQGDRRTGVGIPILGYLVDTPSELVVVDCGLSTRWRGGGAVHLGPDDSPSPGTPYMPELAGPSLAEQVAAMGLMPDRLACTHLHHDHSSGASELGLTLEASAPELERLAGPGAEALGYPADELAGVPTRAVELDPKQPLGPFVASTHLNPDLIAVDTSGHTPGSISILACLGAAWVLICGDALYPRMDDHGAPAWRGMLRIARALQDLRGLRPLPGHDTSVLRAVEPGQWMGTSAPPSHAHD
jgi:glyoxylase-like metal-dependent hydrolase (beta-lactamase superfamily II)